MYFLGNQTENVCKYCISIVYLLWFYCCCIFFFSYRFSARFFAKKSFSYQGDVFSWRGIWLIRMLLNCVLITRLSELWFMGFGDFWDKRLAFCLNRGLHGLRGLSRILRSLWSCDVFSSTRCGICVEADNWGLTTNLLTADGNWWLTANSSELWFMGLPW